MNRCIPKIVKHYKSGLPWGNKQLSSLKNLKNKYHKKYKICGSTFYYGKYAVVRAEYNLLNDKLYKQHLNNIKRSFKYNPRSFFKFVNSKKKILARLYSESTTTLSQVMIQLLVICLPTSLPLLIQMPNIMSIVHIRLSYVIPIKRYRYLQYILPILSNV